MDSKPRSGGLSGEEKRIFMDMVSTEGQRQHLHAFLVFHISSCC